MTKELSRRILRSLKKHYGDVRPDLNFGSLYQLAVAVILSAQTTDRQVNAVTPVLFRKYPDFATLARAEIRDVEEIIRSTGFYRNKARSIVELARELAEKHGGKLPGTLPDLLKLPGIGRKSANVILSMGFNRPALAVDTHVLRLANRLGYAQTENPDRAEEALTSIIPEKDWTQTHLLLIRHGRAVCKARHPLCRDCPVISLCGYEGKTL